MAITKDQYKEIFVKAVKTSRKLTDPEIAYYSPTVTVKKDDITITLTLKKVAIPSKYSTNQFISGLAPWHDANNYDCWIDVLYTSKFGSAKGEKVEISLTEYNYLTLQYKMRFDILNVEVMRRKSALMEKGENILLNFIEKKKEPENN